MTVAEYFESVKDRLFALPFVADFKIIKQVDRSKNGHLRARATLTDNSQLEFSEFIEQNVNNEIQVVTYSYHWSNENGALIRRWDNTPHFPKLRNFPHHIHASEKKVISGKPIDLFGVLGEIEKMIVQLKSQ